MSLLDWCDGLGEKNARASDHRLAVLGEWLRQKKHEQHMFVDPGHVQRLQPDDHGVTSQRLGRQSARLRNRAGDVPATLL